MDQNWCKHYEYVRAIATLIFSYIGSPQVKISQKVWGGATFLTHTVHLPKAIDTLRLGKKGRYGLVRLWVACKTA